MSPWVWSVRLSGVLLLAALVGPTACTVHNGNYCEDAADHYCRPKDAGSGGSGGSGGSDANPGSDAGDAAPDSSIDTAADQAGGGTGGGSTDARDSNGAPDIAPDVAIDIASDRPTDTQPEVTPRCTQASCVAVPSGPFCDSDAGTCTGNCALASPDPCGMVRDGGVPRCEPVSQTCVTCLVDGDCASANKPPHCKPANHQCVACLVDTDCTTTTNLFCVNDLCTTCATTGARTCASRYPGDPTKSTCRNDNATCGECNTSPDCTSDAKRPICVGHVCVACTADGQCAAKAANPGVCMAHQDGRCATPAETIYVQATTATVTCATGAGAGTVTAPLCNPSGTFALLTPTTRRLIVIRGQVASGINWTFPTSPAPAEVSIVGQRVGTSSAAIESGVVPGIRISGAPTYIRGLTVENGSNVGINILNSPKLHMDRVIVQQNTMGGLLVMASGFDITNSIFTANGGVFATPLFGGVYLDIAPNGLVHHFAFNTVLNNAAVGVAVADPTQVILASLLFNPTVGDKIGGVLQLSKAMPDIPLLDSANHLTAASPCHDFVTSGQITTARDEEPPRTPSTPPPLFDIDGDPRPQGPTMTYDCGADELLVP